MFNCETSFITSLPNKNNPHLKIKKGHHNKVSFSFVEYIRIELITF